MTVTHRVRAQQPEEIQAVNEPGLQIECDGCMVDLTHSVRIKCADPACESGDGVDICPSCFCSGKEFGNHKKNHAYRVVELHSYPIFVEDWGADEELLLLEGISLQGLGNWQSVAEHVGTRSRDEVEQHYNSVYVNSPHWPMPRMDREFDIDPALFHERKRRRISTMNTAPPPAPKIAPTSAPGVHEIATFLPGRLEFEHELDNDAEDLVKDLEFGLCYEFGGDELLEDEKDLDVRARIRWEAERKGGFTADCKNVIGVNGHAAPNSHITANGNVMHEEPKSDRVSAGETGTLGPITEPTIEEVVQPPPVETLDSLQFKLTFLEMYRQRKEKRLESKAIMFERGLLDFKKMQAADKKRPKDERDIVHRLRPFARLQTAEDYEVFADGILYESMLRKRIHELQEHRRLGLTTMADVDKYDLEYHKRTQAKNNRDYTSERLQLRAGGRQPSAFGETESRRSHERESTPKTGGYAPGAPPGRKPPAPLNLANAPCLHLLTVAEQTLCSSLRILPKPYLVIKETFVREYARRGGKLRRREARDLVKIDVNKVSRVWDFLVMAGYLKVPSDNSAGTSSVADGAAGSSNTATPANSQTKPMEARPFVSTTPSSSLISKDNGISIATISAPIPPLPVPPAPH